MTNDRFNSVPEGWEGVSDEVVRKADGVVRAALEDDMVVQDLVTYYDRDGNYAGATFVDLGPSSPWDLTPSDLLALTLLSVQAPPYSVRKLLEPSPQRNHVLRLLSEEQLPMDADIAMADDATLLAMAELHEALKLYLSPSHSKAKNPWVTASKLCARKRPDLFPVRDNVVCSMLGLGHNYQVDWQVFRHLLQADDVRQRLDELTDQAAGRGAAVGSPNNRLRHLDAILWMRGARRVTLSS
ncbi:DUF6308 family protein [Knoellia sp. LjRoot47]|uniref:DUF6308 family protein n=1 Tax=Knoellia sp. LjRoot47 TaxID=3342330 RepID=UPI003ECE4BC8